MNIEALIQDCDRMKYDSVALFPKVVTPFPDQISWRGGLDYEAQDRLVAALKSGKYVRAIFYKNHSKKMEIALNTKEAVCNGSQSERFKALKVGDQVATPGGGEIWDVETPWRPGRLIGLRKGRAFRSEDPADMERLKWMVVYGLKRTSNSTNAVVRNAVAYNASNGGGDPLGKFKSDFSQARANLKRKISRVRDSAKEAIDEFLAIREKIGDDVSKMTHDLSPDSQKSAVRFCEFIRKNSVKARDFWHEFERIYVLFDK